jgi:hypothetical protein
VAVYDTAGIAAIEKMLAEDYANSKEVTLADLGK